MSFAIRLAKSRIFKDAEITPVGGAPRIIRTNFTNEDTPSTMGIVTVINDFPTADILSAEVVDIYKKAKYKNMETQEIFYVTKVGPDVDEFTRLDLSRDIP